MIFDTDVLIFVQRGNRSAAELVERTSEREVSVQTYMELLQCAPNRAAQRVIRDFLRSFDFTTIPFSGNIGHRAAIYIEEYSLASGLRAGDAIIAATAVESGLPLASANRKHFRVIEDLELRVFKP